MEEATDILPSGSKIAHEIPTTLNAETSVNWTLSVGGELSSGNTQSYALSSGTDLWLTSGRNSLTLGTLLSIAGANATPDDPEAPYDTTTKKFFAELRYTYFLTLRNALWTSLVERWDPLAGYSNQFIAAGGYLYAFIHDKGQNFTGRVGYAYTRNGYSSWAWVDGDDASIHGLLAALDYQLTLNDNVNFNIGAAYIINANRIEPQDADAWEDHRVAMTSSLISSIAEHIDLEARLLLLYDSKPPAKFSTDTTTLLNVIFTIF